MADFITCATINALDREDIAELQTFIEAAGGDQAAGLEQYVASLREEQAGLYEDVASQLGVQPEGQELFQGGADPRSLEANFAELEDRTFATGRELKEWLQSKALAAQEGGVDLTTRVLASTPQDTIDAMVDAIAPVLEADARYALKDNAGAIGWYNRTVSRALQIAGRVYPEINTDPNARMRFLWALSVTSNGIKVDKNFDYAGQAYEGYKQTGRFPRIEAGEASSAINEHLQLYHKLSEAWGDNALRHFMMTDWTVADIKKLTGIDVSGENASTTVRGSAVLGAKIGNGFYANLNGHFDALTIDRWNMRTMGRIRGTLIESRPDMVQSTGQALRDLVEGMTDAQLTHLRGFFAGKGQIDAEEIGPGMSQEQTEAFAREIKKRSASPEWRANIAKPKGKKWAGDEIRKKGNGLWNWLDGQVEIAGNGTERNMIRAAHAKVLDAMRSDPALGVQDLTMSDLQALLWYPEKRLYDAAKQKEGAERGYEDDDAPDYANAARKWAERNGASLSDERTGNGSDGSLDGEAGDIGGDRGFTDGERRDFSRRAGISSLVRGGDPTAPRAVSGLVTRRSLGDGGRVRGLSVKQKLTAPKNKRFGKWMSDMGVALPPLYELDASVEAQTFSDAIQSSKAEGRFGAAVYVYDTAEYANMRLYMSEDKGAGFAIKEDGDIVSVFVREPKGSVDWLMQAALDQGGTKLDAFDTVLPGIYARHGFKTIERLQWDEQYKPDGWDKEVFKKFNNGEPDVVMMEFDPAYYGYGDELQTPAPRELFQDDTGPRGSIRLPSGGILEGQTVISLFESSNLSTFFHEMGHLSLELMITLGQDANAPAQIQADVAAIRTYLGMDEEQAAPTTEQHETWARTFEAYLMEGKSPSLEMSGAFQRVKAWMTRIYGAVKNLNVKMTPEVKDVLDRMFATEQQIQAARETAAINPLFAEGAPPNMSAADFATWQRLARRGAEEADRKLLDRMMAAKRREKEKWFKDERAAMQDEVEARIGQQPVYQLINGLTDGTLGDKARINRQEIIDIYGEQVLQDLTRERHGARKHLYVKDGASPAEVAETFGYGSHGEMLTDLRSAVPFKQAVQAELDRAMTERYGDPMTDGTIEAEALEAVHNQQSAQQLSAELVYFAKATGRDAKQQRHRVIRARAQQMLGQMQYRNVRPEKFLQEERKASRAAEAAYKKVATGRNQPAALAEAYQAKYQQALNHQLYMLARDWQARDQRMRDKIRKYSTDKVRKKIGSPHIDQIEAILEDYDFKKRTQRDVQNYMDLNQYIQAMDELGRLPELNLDPRIVSRANQTNYTRLSIDELAGLYDTLQNLENMGRRKNEVITKRRTRELNELADKLTDKIIETQGVKDTPEGIKGRAKQTVNLLSRIDTVLVRLDGGEEMGIWYDALKRDIDEAQGEEQGMNVKMMGEVDEIYLRHYSKAELRDLTREKNINGAGNWTKEQILSLALNMGTESNAQRVMDKNVDPEVRMTDQRLDALLGTLTERDWRFVQDTWDYINSYYDEIAKVERRRSGVDPKKVDAKIMWEGAPDFVTGGYYRLFYDPKRSGKARRDEQSTFDQQNSGGWGARAQVSNGMTIQRKASAGGRAVQYSLNNVSRQLRETIRLITLSEAVDATARILKHPEVDAAFQATGNLDTLKMLDLWIKDVANGPIYNADVVNTLSRTVKNNFTLSRLAFNMKTVLLQLTGLSQSQVTIGTLPMLKGIMKYGRGVSFLGDGIVTEVMAMSPFMAERQNTFQKDVYDFFESGKVNSQFASRYTQAKEGLAKAGFAPIQLTQFYGVDMPTWLGAHDDALSQGKSEADAINYADRMVARSQDSGLIGDRSAVERGTVSETTRQSDTVRIFTTLAGYMLTKLNRANVQILKRQMQIRTTDNKIAKVAIATKMAMDLMLLFTVEPLLMAAAYTALTDEDEPEDVMEFLAWETAGSVVGGIPVARDIFSSGRGFTDGGVYGAATNDIGSFFTQIYQGEMDDAAVRAGMNIAGLFTGLPTTQSYRIYEYILGEDETTLPEMLVGSNPLTR